MCFEQRKCLPTFHTYECSIKVGWGNLYSYLNTRTPTLQFRADEIMQTVFAASNFNVHFKNENIYANL